MSYEMLGALAAVGTLLVIAATAVAAVIQLGHMRASNQINTALAIFAQSHGLQMEDRFGFVVNELPEKMQDPAFRAGYASTPVDRHTHPEMYVLDYYHQLGNFLILKLVDERVVMSQELLRATAFWQLLEPSIAILRRTTPLAYIGFEYLVSRARQASNNPAWMNSVTNFRRLAVHDVWSSDVSGKG